MKRYIYIHLFGLLLFCSCLNVIEIPPSPPVEASVERTFRIDVPGMNKGLTRATNESAIGTLHMIAFDENNYFVSYAEAKKQTGTGNQYKVQLPMGNMRLVFLANITAAMIDALSLKAGESTFNDFATGLKFLLESNGMYWWEVSSNGNIPMYYDAVTPVTIQADDKVLFAGQAIQLKRSVAKISVNVSNEAKKDFELKNIIMYNGLSTVQVVPHLAGEIAPQGDSPTTDIKGKTVAADKPLYVAEQANNQNTQFHPCVILQGKFQRGSSSYYRVDLVDKNGKYLNIERNKDYQINIVAIKRAGFGTEAGALSTGGVNVSMDVQYTTSEESNEIDHYTYNQHYYLGTEEVDLLFGDAESSQTIKFETNAPDDQVSISADQNWITVSKSTRPSDQKIGTLTIEVSANNTTGAVLRKGKVTVTVGQETGTAKKLSRELIVTQYPYTFNVFTDIELKVKYDQSANKFVAERYEAGNYHINDHHLYINSLYAWRLVVEEPKDKGKVFLFHPQSGPAGTFDFHFQVVNSNTSADGAELKATLNFYQLTEQTPFYTTTITSQSYAHNKK